MQPFPAGSQQGRLEKIAGYSLKALNALARAKKILQLREKYKGKHLTLTACMHACMHAGVCMHMFIHVWRCMHACMHADVYMHAKASNTGCATPPAVERADAAHAAAALAVATAAAVAACCQYPCCSRCCCCC